MKFYTVENQDEAMLAALEVCIGEWQVWTEKNLLIGDPLIEGYHWYNNNNENEVLLQISRLLVNPM